MFLKRNAFDKLIAWKNDPKRKPLILKGARQVGKTWLMKEFGRTQYSSYVSFNFDEEEELKSIFEANKNPQRIIELLGLLSGQKILPGETLAEVLDNLVKRLLSFASAKKFTAPRGIVDAASSVRFNAETAAAISSPGIFPVVS